MRRRQITYSSHPNRAARTAHARGDKLFRTYDTSYIRPKRSNAPVVIGVIVIIAAIVAIVLALIFLFPKGETAPSLAEGQEVVVTIDQGEAAKAIGQSLAEVGVVGSADAFVDAVRAADAESSLIPGTYLFAGGMTVDDVVTILRTGPEATADKLVVPEGLTREATAQAVAEATHDRITAESFLESSSDASRWAPTYGFLDCVGDNSLEGFLFPKTYSLLANDTADQVVAMMLDQFATETANLSYTYPESHGLDLYGAVTLASIVEKEATADTMPLVASVFYNRLASDRPYLESDATTAYEVGHDPSVEEVHAETPYSTYTNPGLPPTPICSPSLAALEAVCNPAETDYRFFFFYDGPDGQRQYVFSQTYEEHDAAYNEITGG